MYALQVIYTESVVKSSTSSLRPQTDNEIVADKNLESLTDVKCWNRLKFKCTVIAFDVLTGKLRKLKTLDTSAVAPI